MRFLARGLVALVGIAIGQAAQAVCLDVRDPLLNTYRYPTLKEEAADVEAIAVGTVVSTKGISIPADSADPEGFDEFIYTIALVETIKGRLPKQFELHASNSSGGYRVSDGETHLMLIHEFRGTLYVDPCGNSSLLRDAGDKLERLRNPRLSKLPLSASDVERVKRSAQYMHSATVHGRLRYYNGNPTARIWIVGENHMLGVRDADPGVNMPRELSDLMSFDRDIFADFRVEPLVEFKPGVMRIVRIVSASKVVVTENDKIVFMKDKL